MHSLFNMNSWFEGFPLINLESVISYLHVFLIRVSSGSGNYIKGHLISSINSAVFIDPLNGIFGFGVRLIYRNKLSHKTLTVSSPLYAKSDLILSILLL